MTEQRPDRTDRDIFTDVPEADAAEQATPVIPDDDLLEAATARPPATPTEADPADAWEQALPVPGPDEDYDYQQPEP